RMANSKQYAVHANTPTVSAHDDVPIGPSSATQTPTSSATANVSNNAETEQEQTLNQGVGGLSSCVAGCGGAGGFQLGIQKAETEQWAFGIAKSDQNAVNTNAPHAVAGWAVN